MSKTTDQLRARAIFNSYDFAHARGPQGNVPTDPKAHWRDYGKMAFTVHGRDRCLALWFLLIAWASEYFGVAEWKREPFGAWMPAEFVDARLKQLKEWMASLDTEGEGS